MSSTDKRLSEKVKSYSRGNILKNRLNELSDRQNYQEFTDKDISHLNQAALATTNLPPKQPP